MSILRYVLTAAVILLFVAGVWIALDEMHKTMEDFIVRCDEFVDTVTKRLEAAHIPGPNDDTVVIPVITDIQDRPTPAQQVEPTVPDFRAIEPPVDAETYGRHARPVE